MKLKTLLLASIVCTTSIAFAKVTLVAPQEGEVVCQLYPTQLKFVSQNKEQRDRYFTDSALSKAMRKDGSRPKPITLKWEGDKASYQVSVKRLSDGKEFFALTVPSNSVAIDSLEIARTWEWTVTANGESAKGTFKTEDRAPRLINVKGVGNARDVGGRIGLNGKRIRQGLFFRTSGLNNNAPKEMYTVAEVEEMLSTNDPKKLKKLGHRARDLRKKMKDGKKITDKDISRAKLVKRDCFKPGTKRLTEEERQRVMAAYGFKSDIDLRTDKECYGMTGSPLGPDAKWWHVPYSGYSGAFTDDGKKRDLPSYRVMADANNYPLVVHCIGGADRTGTFCMLFEALLGVEEDELWKDYLTTGFAGVVADASHQKSFGGAIDALKKYPGETLADKAEAYFIDCGLTKENVATIRLLLLEN